jgi:cobalt-zinc-cadmium efflux system outer membrane protein
MGALLERKHRALAWLLLLAAGCAPFSLTRPIPVHETAPIAPAAQNNATDEPIQTVSHQEPGAALLPPEYESPAAPGPDTEPPFAGMSELSVEALVQEVLGRNPTLAQMLATWEAVQARYPQVTSLDDPMFAVTLGPHTYLSNRVNPAYRFNVEQKYPWPGKLALRGERVRAEARAAGNDVGDVRLQLVESAKVAFYDYYLVHRALAVNQESIRLLQEFRKNAESRYRTGKGPQQDMLQADVELGRERDRRLSLEKERAVAAARINTLLSLAPGSPLPQAPRELHVEDGLPSAEALRALALKRRPDLKAIEDRIVAEQAALSLAYKDFYPDFTPFAMYDRFMGNNFQSLPLAMMVGVGVNLPVRRDRRFAAVREAQARISERRAEYARQVNQINYDVQQSYAEVERSKNGVRLYEKSILPAAEANVKSAQAAYITGQIPFLSLIEAQRNLIGLRDRYYELIADFYRRQANLERAIGGPINDTESEVEDGAARQDFTLHSQILQNHD